MPAVVNIPVELKEQAATQNQGNEGQDNASPFGPGDTPLDSKDVNGVAAGEVPGDIPAGELDIQPGDIIVSVDQQPVTAPDSAAAQLKEAAAQGNVLLLINRHGTNQF